MMLCMTCPKKYKKYETGSSTSRHLPSSFTDIWSSALYSASKTHSALPLSTMTVVTTPSRTKNTLRSIVFSKGQVMSITSRHMATQFGPCGMHKVSRVIIAHQWTRQHQRRHLLLRNTRELALILIHFLKVFASNMRNTVKTQT